MKPLSFFVRGKAATSGSKHGFAIKKGGQYTGRVAMIGANPREKDWKNTVASWAIDAMKKAGLTEPFDGPIRLEIVFYMQRPQGHYNTAGKVKDRYNELHTSKPDTTKMLRCLEDALKQVVWRDDSQVCTTLVAKRYGEVPGAQVTISQEVPAIAVVSAPAIAVQPSLFEAQDKKALLPSGRGGE